MMIKMMSFQFLLLVACIAVGFTFAQEDFDESMKMKLKCKVSDKGDFKAQAEAVLGRPLESRKDFMEMTPEQKIDVKLRILKNSGLVDDDCNVQVENIDGYVDEKFTFEDDNIVTPLKEDMRACSTIQDCREIAVCFKDAFKKNCM